MRALRAQGRLRLVGVSGGVERPDECAAVCYLYVAGGDGPFPAARASGSIQEISDAGPGEDSSEIVVRLPTPIQARKVSRIPRDQWKLNPMANCNSRISRPSRF